MGSCSKTSVDVVDMDLNGQMEYVSILKPENDCQRKFMFQRVQVRLYSGAQYALCGCQHSNAPDTKQRGFLCNSLGWQAGRLFCVTWHCFVGKVLIEPFLPAFVHLVLPKPSQGLG